MAALKPFQQADAEFLAARTRALLASEPGVGKTASLITAANLVGARRVKVVCPDIGVEHWGREFKKWGLIGGGDVVSWDDAHKLAALYTAQGGPGKLPMQWDVLIADECHFSKNPQARRAKAVLGKGGLGWYARRIWAASGTPAPNHAGELWTLLRAFGKTKMDLETFTNYFCVVDGMGKVRGNRPDHINELRDIIKEFSRRRLKRDVLPELGAIDVQDWYVKPSRDFITGSLHDATCQEAQLRAELQSKSDEDILAFLSDPHEDFSTLRRYNALLKAPAVFETVKFELANGLLDKVVIYGYHKEALAALHLEFGRHAIGSVLIYGNTPRAERDGLIEKWKHSAHVPVIIASLVIASTAIDLTAAHQVIALECDWTPGVNSQAWQRPHRQGQTNPVTVRVAHGTPIDEIVNGVVMRKTKDLAEIFS